MGFSSGVLNGIVVAAAIVVGALLLMLGIHFVVMRIGRVIMWRQKGIRWEKIVELARDGTGCLVIDHAIGRARGLGDVVVWWLPEPVTEPKLVPMQIDAAGKLTDCPAQVLGYFPAGSPL